MPLLLIASARRAFASLLTLLLVTTIMSAACRPATAADHGDVVEWELADFKEPSGIVYHPGRRTLFVCGDEGDVGEVSLEGKLLRSARVEGDLEAITVVPETGLLYVVREGHEILLELRPQDFKLTRRFNIQRDFAGDDEFLESGGNGIEGLTFVPDADHPEGGRFFAVNQDDPPVLIELDVPLRSLEGKFGEARVANSYNLSVRPLSGLLWLEDTRRFLVASSLWRAVYVVTDKGVRLATIPVPGLMQEGLARLPDGSFVIVQDVGGLIKWTPESDPFASPGGR